MSEEFGNFVPEIGTGIEREIVQYQMETPSGVSTDYSVQHLRISSGNNLVMNTGEDGLIVLHSVDEMKNIPDGIRGANAAARLVRDTAKMDEKMLDGRAKNLQDLLVEINLHQKNLNPGLILRINHDENKGRAFSFHWVEA